MKKKFVSFAAAVAIISALLPNSITTAADNGLVTAFPGAEGAGKYATGGRGGKIYHVTNLNDSGAGSFRDAVSGSNRIVVFDVGGTIELKKDVVVKGNVTIAGQTAPGGGGITLKGGKLGMGGDNIIVRFVSSRPGENGESECDAWGGSAGSNSVIDHCSIGWANDEQFGLYSNNVNQTVQYSIIGPSNCISYHSKGAHGFGIMFGKGNNSWHHNMIAHNISRNYRGKVVGTMGMDYVNNVIFDWGYQTAYGTHGRINYVGNYFKAGLSTNGGHRFINISSGTSPENYRFYLTGNKMVKSDGTDYNTSLNENNWIGINYGKADLTESDYRVDTYIPVYDVNGNDASVAPNAQSADDAFETVLAYAGAGITASSRPRIDREVMEEARTGNGYLTGGRDFSTLTDSDSALLKAIKEYNIKQMNYDEYYPTAVLTKDITDSDNDGMSDEWELARGLDPNNASDAMGDYLGQGYNNIEYYINDLTVDAFPEGVVEVSPTTTDLGEDYTNAQEDAAAISLSPTTISSASDLTLPTAGTLHGSSISWSSASSAVVIKNNKITKVKRPSESNLSVSLVANVTCGEYTVKKYFTINVLSSTSTWTASSSDAGKSAGTKLMNGLTNVSELTGGSLNGTVVNGKSFGYYVSGSDSGGYSNGVGTGTAFKYVASENGYLSAYITALGENKTAYIVEEGRSDKKEYNACISGTDGANQMIASPVEAGKTYYIFVAGSKGRFTSISFSTDAPVYWWKASADAAAGSVLMKNLTPAEDMKYTDYSSVTIDGEEFTGAISGTTNPTNNGEGGSALHYTAPGDGYLTVFYKLNSNKTYTVNDKQGNVVGSYKNEDESSEYISTTYLLSGGTTYYIYVAGSKAAFYGAAFTQTGNDAAGTTPEPSQTAEPVQTPIPTATPVPTMEPQLWKASKTVTTGEKLMTGLTSAGELTYTDKPADVGDISFNGFVNGSVNANYTDGVFSGNGLIFTAPVYGELTVYMQVGTNKTIMITDGENNAVAEWLNVGDKTEKALSATVEKGKTYYAYVKGSNARIYGAYFEEKEAPKVTDEPAMGLTLAIDGENVVCTGNVDDSDGKDVYIAQYAANGRLLGVRKISAQAQLNESAKLNESTSLIKVMVWKGTEAQDELVSLIR